MDRHKDDVTIELGSWCDELFIPVQPVPGYYRLRFYEDKEKESYRIQVNTPSIHSLNYNYSKEKFLRAYNKFLDIKDYIIRRDKEILEKDLNIVQNRSLFDET